MNRNLLALFIIPILLIPPVTLPAATPADLWPEAMAVPDKAALKAGTDAISSAESTLPPELKPALDFQRIFLRILSGEPASTWHLEMEKLAASTALDPVSAGVREAARVWVARLQINSIDAVMRVYYRKHVAFPSSLSEVENDLPGNLRKDPWGEPWVYRQTAPYGFAKLASQRYQLGPTRYPDLLPLPGAAGNRKAAARSWTTSLILINGQKALKIKISDQDKSPSVIQPGGKIGNCFLLYIGDSWALMAETDRLFTINLDYIID
jgi:hypothetical protein